MKNHAANLIIIFALSLGVYANAFGNDFVWDDEIFITQNRDIQNLSAWPTYFLEGSENLYRPLRTVLYAITWKFSGANPLGYHIVGKTLNALAALSLYALVCLIFESPAAAFWGTLLWALHPVHTEKVTFITSTFDIFGDFLWLSAFTCYVAFRKSGKGAYFGASLFLFAAGLFSAENAAALPALVVLYDLTFGATDKKPARWVPFFLLLAAYLAVRTSVLGMVARGGERILNPDFFGNLIVMGGVVAAYIKLLVAPWPLSVEYAIRTGAPYPLGLYLAAALITAALAATALRAAKEPWLPFSAFWFFIALSPNLNFIPAGSLMAERYLYMPSAAAAFLIAAAWNALANDAARRKMLAAAFIAVAMAFSGLVIARNRNWRNEAVLWSATLKNNPHSFLGLLNLGIAAFHKKEYGMAEELLHRAAAERPDKGEPLSALGDIAMARGNFVEAESFYRHAHALRHRDIDLLNAGIAAVAQKEFERGEKDIAGVLERNPWSGDAAIALGDAFFLAGKQGWRQAYVRAHRLSGEAGTVIKLADCLRLSGDAAGARRIAAAGHLLFPNEPAFAAPLGETGGG